MNTNDFNRLKRDKRAADSKARLIKQWDQILSEEGLSMERGISKKLSYVGGTNELTILEKLNDA